MSEEERQARLQQRAAIALALQSFLRGQTNEVVLLAALVAATNDPLLAGELTALAKLRRSFRLVKPPAPGSTTL